MIAKQHNNGTYSMGNQKTRIPRQKTVDDVFDAIKNKAGMNRKAVMVAANKTGHCTDLCLESLIDSGKVLRRLVRMSGPYKVYSYELN